MWDAEDHRAPTDVVWTCETGIPLGTNRRLSCHDISCIACHEERITRVKEATAFLRVRETLHLTYIDEWLSWHMNGAFIDDGLLAYTRAELAKLVPPDFKSV